MYQLKNYIDIVGYDGIPMFPGMSKTGSIWKRTDGLMPSRKFFVSRRNDRNDGWAPQVVFYIYVDNTYWYVAKGLL